MKSPIFFAHLQLEYSLPDKLDKLQVSIVELTFNLHY
ncbi:hypothetical protein SAMN05444376_0667 [Bacteroides clarus YIT 12056]|jgi:hypothetical protein|nr:hypothetical protein SAMN05444376_0667 [Bacteroides clarus YIT 12056]